MENPKQDEKTFGETPAQFFKIDDRKIFVSAFFSFIPFFKQSLLSFLVVPYLQFFQTFYQPILELGISVLRILVTEAIFPTVESIFAFFGFGENSFSESLLLSLLLILSLLLFLAIILSYIYLVSCLLVFVWDKLRSKIMKISSHGQ